MPLHVRLQSAHAGVYPQLPEPLQFVTHIPPAQSTSVLPSPLALMVQPPPAQLALNVPAPWRFITQSPSGQLSEQVPALVQFIVQPPPSHVSVQLPAPTQLHTASLVQDSVDEPQLARARANTDRKIRSSFFMTGFYPTSIDTSRSGALLCCRG